MGVVQITAHVISMVQTGTKSERNLFIISQQSELLAEQIQTHLGLNVTRIPINQEKKQMMLMCIVNKHHYYSLEELLDHYDKDALVVVTNVSDIRGNITKVKNQFSSHS